MTSSEQFSVRYAAIHVIGEALLHYLGRKSSFLPSSIVQTTSFLHSDKKQPVRDSRTRKELEKEKTKDKEARTFQIRSNKKKESCSHIISYAQAMGS